MNIPINDEMLNMSILKALQSSGQDIEPSNLYDWQVSAIRSSIDNLTTIVSVPTGSGKTLVFQLLPFIFTDLRKINCFTLIISPLIALISNQIKIFGDSKCIQLERTSNFDEIFSNIVNGNVIYGLFISSNWFK